LGQSKQVDRVEIRWPSGVHQTLRAVRTNQVLRIEEPAQ
jgi:ASPIC/UnbV protein